MARHLESAHTQHSVLAAILDAYELGETPTLDEVAHKLGTTKSNVSRALGELEEKGFIECDRTPTGRMKARGIRLTKLARSRPVPLLGRVAAGEPIFVEGENVKEYLPLPAQYVRGAEVYMLEVDGDSMIGDGILIGDYVIVDRHPAWRDGDMVVVLHKNAATVKRVWRKGSSIFLESSNPKYEAIILKEEGEQEDRPEIQGRVIGLVRWNIQQ
jgi:repressor LexA